MPRATAAVRTGAAGGTVGTMLLHPCFLIFPASISLL